MSASGTYKRILQVLEHWPIDKTKTGRDFGEHIRDYISKIYSEGKFEGKEQYWDKQFLALQRLVNNEHKKKYPRTVNSSATGLTADECKSALSNEFLKFMEQDQSMFKRMFSFTNKESRKL